jgi:hypothetical protein
MEVVIKDMCLENTDLGSSFMSSSSNLCSLFFPPSFSNRCLLIFPNLSSLFLLSIVNTRLLFDPVHGEVYIEFICIFPPFNEVIITFRRTICSNINFSVLSLHYRTLKQRTKTAVLLSSWTLFLRFILKCHPLR